MISVPKIWDQNKQVHQEKRRQGVNHTEQLAELEHAIPGSCVFQLSQVLDDQKSNLNHVD